MTLVERLEKCRKELDWKCREKATTDDYSLEIAALRDLIESAENKIRALLHANKSN